MPENYSNPTISDIEISLIDMHPYQAIIRPYSAKYETHVEEEAVDQYSSNMKLKGYDRAQPIVIRPIEDGRYQCVVGWQRRTAMVANGETHIPAVVREMTEDEAAMDLVLHQGKQIGAWGQARHAYQVCVVDNLLSQSAYAREIGKNHSTVNEWVSSVKVFETVATARDGVLESPEQTFTVRIAREIATLPEEDWKWFTAKILEKNWTVKTVEKVRDAVKEVRIPEEFSGWLNPVKLKKEIAEMLGDYDDPLPLENVKSNIKDAQSILAKLPEDRTVMEFEDGLPRAVSYNLKQRFINCLVETKPNTRSGISTQYQRVLDLIKKLDEKYQRWEAARRSEEEQAKALEEVERTKLRLEKEFTPVGFNAPIDRLDLEAENFDAVFMEYPPQEENINWPTVVRDALKPGGVLVALCESGDDLFFLAEEVARAELTYLELRPWVFPATELGERFTENTGFVVVYAKEGELPYLPDTNTLIDKVGRDAGNTAITFLKGDSKDKVYGELVRYLLLCYAPPSSQIFCPCTYAPQIVKRAKSAKDMAYKVAWSCIERSTFNKIIKEVDEAPFYWESH